MGFGPPLLKLWGCTDFILGVLPAVLRPCGSNPSPCLQTVPSDLLSQPPGPLKSTSGHSSLEILCREDSGGGVARSPTDAGPSGPASWKSLDHLVKLPELNTFASQGRFSSPSAESIPGRQQITEAFSLPPPRPPL